MLIRILVLFFKFILYCLSNTIMSNFNILIFSLIFCVIFFIDSTSLVSIHSHSHSHVNSKERVEDGAYSPKMYDHFGKKSEAELIHESMLGSAKDAEEFDHLPADESKRRLRLLLSKIDANHDEYIDPEELYSWIVKSFKKLSDEEAEERFDDTDVNKDGVVTWKEQLFDSFGDESHFDESSIEDALMIKADKRLFNAADLDKDGNLNRTEYKRYCSPEDFADMLPVLIENTLEEKDTNKDGVIDFAEFIGNDDKMSDKNYLVSERESFDFNYDKNNDGVLNHDEVLNWIVPNSSLIAAEETRHLMVAADDNHDYLLSFDEIINNHDVFVGSEATDFGEHLQNIHTVIDEL